MYVVLLEDGFYFLEYFRVFGGYLDGGVVDDEDLLAVLHSGQSGLLQGLGE